MYKIVNIGIPKDLTDLTPKHEIGYIIRNGNKSLFNCRTESFKNSFFPYTIEAWYSLDPTIINSKSLEVFNPLCAHPTKWSNILKQIVGKLPKNCLSVSDRFVGLALKVLKVNYWLLFYQFNDNL